MRGGRGAVWSEGDLATLDKVYPHYEREEIIALIPGHSWGSIQREASVRSVRRLRKTYRGRQEEKVCKKCGILKSRSSFDATSRQGTRGICKDCYGKFRYSQIKSDPRQYRNKLDHVLISVKKRYRQHLFSKFGITEEDYQGMLASQNGTCAICRRSKARLALDHDHKTGRLRALLCWRCNMAIAILEDPEWLGSATSYLEEHKK
jgi:hypothetical protein